MKVTVCDISGMGGRESGGYEWGCQIICARAAEFIRQRKTESQLPSYLENPSVIGLAIPNNDIARQMDEYIIQHPKLREYGMTGAMHQYGVAHGRKLAELGREEYLRQCREIREAEDFFEFEEDDAFPERVTA